MIPKSVIQAVYALYYLSRQPPGAAAPAEALAELLNVPIPSAAKLLNRLMEAGWADMVRGSGGGYVLTCPLARISVVEIFDRFVEPRDVSSRKSEDIETLRTVEWGMISLENGLRQALGSRTLDEVLKIKDGKDPPRKKRPTPARPAAPTPSNPAARPKRHLFSPGRSFIS